MKKNLFFVLVVLCLALLAGCSCDHVWLDATCTEPDTCKECGETDGEPLGHDWEGATCTTLKTCEDCGATEGELANHDWKDASCYRPSYCKACYVERGEKLEHTWKDATCTDPQTCRVCGEYAGEPLGHSFGEATCTEKAECTVCGRKDGEPLGHDYVSNQCTRCGDKEIETYEDLVAYLNRNYPTLYTPVGAVEELTYEIEVHDPNIFEECDFEVQIRSQLYCDELKSSMSYIIYYGDVFTFEERIQAFADIITFELDIAAFVEDVFPGKKFSVSYFLDGYEYPNLQVGYNSTCYLPIYNYERNGSGKTGYAGTDLCDWYMNEKHETFLTSYQGFSKEADKFYDAVIAKTGYDLRFKFHSSRYM